MKVIKFVWLVAIVAGLTNCHRDADILPGSITYDIVGNSYPNGTLALFDGRPTIFASSLNYESCINSNVLFTCRRPVTNEAQLSLSFNVTAFVNRYVLDDTSPVKNICSTDSAVISVSVSERPVPGYIDLEGLAAYRLLNGGDSYLEITRFDEKRRWVEGKFELKAVRTGVMGYPLPLSDTLVIRNGKFSFGFKRE